jgi:8-oxo-dGTP diphosphatase
MKYEQPYVAPILTVDLVLFRIEQGVLQVLLMRRPAEPFKGALALPGGYNSAGETTLEALARIIREKVGIDMTHLSYKEQLYTFETVARDPRGHAVSVTYMGCTLNRGEPLINEATFFPLSNLPIIAFDHINIIHYAHRRLISKLMYTNAAYAFLKATFTLTELQLVYETILGYALDKRNFRKKFIGLDLITETNELRRDGAHRPAKLYRFKSSEIEELTKNFD